MSLIRFSNSVAGNSIKLDVLLKSSLFSGSSTDYPLNTLSETANDTAHMPAISQGEHLLIGVSCYFIHPCETSMALKDILGSTKEIVSPSEVLETWMMLVGSVINLK